MRVIEKIRETWRFYPSLQKRVREILPEFYHETLDVDVVEWDPDLEAADVDTPGYRRTVLGVAYPDPPAVAFRGYPPTAPTPHVFIHELGHIFFGLRGPYGEQLWNRAYTGAETLLWVFIQGQFKGSEENVWRYIEYLRMAEEDTVDFLKVGCIPADEEIDPELLRNDRDLRDPDQWTEVPYTERLRITLLQEIVEGLVIEDYSFSPTLAHAIGLVEGQHP